MSAGDEKAEIGALFARLAAGVRPAELSAERRSALKRRVRDLARATSATGTSTVRADDGEWLNVSPLVDVKILKRDASAGTQTMLMRVAPGGRIPAHRHTLEEEFIVIEGECRIGTHTLRSGDVHVAEAGSWHDDITTTAGALVMVRGEIRAGVA